MSGIMNPISGEQKKRTCYFFDSGAFLTILARRAAKPAPLPDVEEVFPLQRTEEDEVVVPDIRWRCTDALCCSQISGTTVRSAPLLCAQRPSS